MAQNLSTIQKKFVQETCRPMIEELIKMRYKLDAFVKDYDNQQTPIVANEEILNDGVGDNPREDAPNLTGTRLSQLRTFSNNMLNQIDSSISVLVELSVRDLYTIIKE